MEYRFSHQLFMAAVESALDPPDGWLDVILQMDLPPRERGPTLARAIRLGAAGRDADEEERCVLVLLADSEIERLEYRLDSSYSLLHAAGRLTRASHASLCNVHRRASIQCDWLGRVPAAFEHLQLAQDHAAKIPDEVMVARLVSDQGILELYHRSAREALDSFLRSAAATGALGAKWEQAMALGNAGIACRHLGELDDAVEYIQRSEHVYNSIGDMEGVARKMSERANLLASLGEPERALELCEEALEIRELLGDKRELAMGWGVKANILMELGRLNQARDWFSKAGAAFEELGSNRDSATTFSKLGMVAMYIGDGPASEKALLKSLQLSRSAGAHAAAVDTLFELAWLKMLERRATEAFAFLSEVTSVPSEALRPAQHALVLSAEGWVAYFERDLSRALSCFDRAKSLVPTEGKGTLTSTVHAGLAAVSLAQDDRSVARDHALTALEHLSVTDPAHVLEHLMCLNVLVAIEAAAGNLGEARGLVTEGMGRLQQIRDSGWRAMPLIEQVVTELDGALRQPRT
ncbi:MAG: tetratricopeptide repeat protein [Planctomycetes bacterium]|nr:tetratricopeptide repeat protein [Planctomycetota bacterium]